MPSPEPLTPRQLRKACLPDDLPFDRLEELGGLEDGVGQARAMEALRFGVAMRRGGYNLFALGPTGTGKHETIQSFLEQESRNEAVPSDWVYVRNPEQPERPMALELPPGRGQTLRERMDDLTRDLTNAIQGAFESEDYRTRRQAIEDAFKERHDKVLDAFKERAQKQGITLVRAPVGMALAPMRDGKVLSFEEFEDLPEDERKAIQKDIEALQGELQQTLQQVPKWEREHREEVRSLDREITGWAVQHLIDDIRQAFEDVPAVVQWLDQVKEDVVEHASDFIQSREQQGGPQQLMQMVQGSPLDRYRVNVLVDHAGLEGAPVVYEDHPTLPNLIGRVEHQPRMGALVTDHTLIRPGALHRASGGYLVLDARKLLLQPLAWEQLKRALSSGEVRIESPGQILSVLSTVTLEPEPIPVSVKVLLVGERILYYLLDSLDPDFRELFKVPADFEEEMDRDQKGLLQFGRMLMQITREEGLLPLDRQAMGAMVERASRLAGDAGKVSAHLHNLTDLLREAEHHARQDGAEHIRESHVREAIELRERREGRLRDRLHEQIELGTLRIDTDGAVAGQVNGLSVLQIGRFSFGRPNRITARIRLGRGQVVDIEREVALGGPLHSKGVLILHGYLAQRYAQDRPLALWASLVFEQSYGGVDGDSASMAELCALLSALAEVPIRQAVAMTGSVDQTGRVQPIGGVNEKIEGFYDVCAARGLNGDQGVIIPRANLRHLMVRPEVVDAADAGKFHIWAVDRVDEALELISGLEAGERDGQGRFPEGSFNAQVEARLEALAEAARAFTKRRPEDGAG